MTLGSDESQSRTSCRTCRTGRLLDNPLAFTLEVASAHATPGHPVHHACKPKLIYGQLGFRQWDLLDDVEDPDWGVVCPRDPTKLIPIGAVELWNVIFDRWGT